MSNFNTIYVGHDEFPLYECRTCGVLVAVPGLHARWHRLPTEGE